MSIRLKERRLLVKLAAALLPGGPLLATRTAVAQTAWPAQPVKIVVPYPAGGSTDVFARLLARRFSEVFGHTFIVENRSGANGNLGAAAVASAAPDGSTLMVSTTGPLSLNKLLYRATSFDPSTDFTPIALLADVPLLLAAHPSLPARSVPELLAYLKANPGQVNYASSGTGSMGHLAALLMQRATGTSMTHVPYKGSAPAINDLLGGVVKLSFDLVPQYLPHISAGKVRAMAVLGPQRAAVLPDVPTFVESGVPINATGWFGLVGPKGMPAALVDKLNRATNDFLGSLEGKAQLQTMAMRPIGGKPDDLAAFVRSELKKWAPIIEPIATTVMQ